MISYPGRILLLAAGILAQFAGQLGALAWSDHPANDIAAEDIENHLRIEVGPLGWAHQFGDIPTPRFVGRRCQQLGLCIGRMGSLVAAFTRVGVLFQNAIHRPCGAVVDAFIQ
jgi:hypothetical protein